MDDAKFAPLPEAYERMPLADSLPLPNPLSMLVDPTSLCNFRCKFCPTGDPHLIKESGRHRGFMPLDLFRRIVAGISEFKTPLKVLRLYKDGEPLLHPEFAEFVRIAKSCGRIERVETTTNGSRLDRATADAILGAGIDRIVISVEGVTAERYRDFARVRIDFDAFVANLAHLYANRGSCQVHIKTVDENLGEGEAQRFREIFAPIADRCYIERTVPSWPTFDVQRLLRKDGREADAQHRPLVRKRICPYLFYSMSINSDGSVSPCCVDWRRDLVIGNAADESLLEIWNGPRLRALRRTHIQQGRAGNPTCAGCGQIDYCVTENLDAAQQRLERLFGGH
jgi:radical SAM protein with 4Fe4S-binding SPASM domain